MDQENGVRGFASRYAHLRCVVAYATTLSGNHPFVDGNKRVVFHPMLVFLRLHGLAVRATAREATERMLALAAGRASEAELTARVGSRR